MSYAEHQLDIYGTRIYCATTKKQWKHLSRDIEKVKHKAPKYLGQVTSPGSNVFVVWINSKAHEEPGDLIDTCAHEASHLAGFIFDGISHNTPNTDEPHAYLCGWLTRWIWEHCA